MDVLEQAGACPETVTLVAVDLVERFTDVHPAAFEFDVHHGQAVDEHGDVVPVGAGGPALAFGDLVLVDDLETIVVNVLLIDQADVLH